MHLPLGGRLEGSGLDAQLRGELGQFARSRGLGQQQFQHRLPRLRHLLGFGVDDQAVLDRMAARGHQLRARAAFRSRPGTRGRRRRAAGRGSCTAWGS